MSSSQDRSISVLAVASGGGHWEQMMLLRPALGCFNTTYVTTQPGAARRDGIGDNLAIPDSSRHSPFAAMRTMLRAVAIVMKLQPDVVVTTGALPGLACLVVGRMLGARTVWIDSMANSERLSISGRFAKPFATLWVTQWQGVADATGARYEGCLL